MTTFNFARAEDSPGFLLWQVANLWQRQVRSALAPLGITHVQFVLLAGVGWLTNTGIAVTQVQLAQHAHTDIMMTSQVVRTLAAKGFLTRVSHPADSRAKVLTLTAPGHAVTQQAITVVEAVDAHFFHAALAADSTFTLSLQQLIATPHLE